MNLKFNCLLCIMLLLASLPWTLDSTKVTQASSSILEVPVSYNTIQAAINAANPGDTIMVSPGTYYEHLIVNKTVSLIGQAKEATIIDGSGNGTVIRIEVSSANLSGFTIKHGGQRPWEDSGVFLQFGSTNNRITNNIIVDNYHGIFLESSNGNSISFNNISLNTGRGINLESSSRNVISSNFISQNEWASGVEFFDSAQNLIEANTISYSGWAGINLIESPSNTIIENALSNNLVVGISLDTSVGNILYRNNLVANGLNEQGQIGIAASAGNVWDNSAEGNYWSDYAGADSNGDGVGDTSIPHLGVDLYPLMEPWARLRTFVADGSIVTILSNSTIASFSFNRMLERMSFNVTGASETLGFCNVTIPKDLLSGSYPKNWTVTLDDSYISFLPRGNVTHSSLYFTYSHSTHSIRIALIELPNLPPNADFTYLPLQATPFDVVSFTDLSVDSDGGVTSWYWEFGDGNNSTDSNPQHQYSVAGTYVVTLYVVDDRGTQTVTSKAVPVRKVRTFLVAAAPSSVNQGQLFEITANLTDENDHPVTNAVVWVYLLEEKWETKGSYLTNSSGIALFTYRPLNEGMHRFRMLFNGTLNLAGSENAFVVEALEFQDVEPPIADAGSDRTVYLGDFVIFDGARSSDNIGITSYYWDFGDEDNGIGVSANHTYTNPGEYTVTLTVQDFSGNTDVDTVTVTVLSRTNFAIWAAVVVFIAIGVIVAALVLLRKSRRRQGR